MLPAVLTSGESPNVAWNFYKNLGRSSRLFKHAHIFSGFSSRVSPTTVFHPHFWPNARLSMLEGPPWKERKLVGMVASSKVRFSINRNRLTSRLMFLVRYMRVQLYQLTDPMLRFQDLYTLRIAAIEEFAPKPQFYLYGKGWAESVRNWQRIRQIHFYNAPVCCKDKMETLSHFRFSLCFENCVYPGYVTEKIFDGFFAGSVPVYMGAPDITGHIPTDCFIDYRRYSSFKELWKDLESMSERRWQNYREAIKSFLVSPAFMPFKQETLAAKLFKWLTLS